jgi:hypothetical protein
VDPLDDPLEIGDCDGVVGVVTELDGVGGV